MITYSYNAARESNPASKPLRVGWVPCVLLLTVIQLMNWPLELANSAIKTMSLPYLAASPSASFSRAASRAATSVSRRTNSLD